MTRKKRAFLKGLGAIILVFTMLITMLPSTEVWAADVNGPVIESTSLNINGRTDVTVGEKVKFTFTGYDQDSEIVWVYLLGDNMPD